MILNATTEARSLRAKAALEGISDNKRYERPPESTSGRFSDPAPTRLLRQAHHSGHIPGPAVPLGQPSS